MRKHIECDHIIVGSGTVESVLAARLSEYPKGRILVLEEGGSDRQFWLRLPVGYFRSPDGYPTRAVIAGSGSFNGLIYLRGQQQGFDGWEALGESGRGYCDVLKHCRNFESCIGQPATGVSVQPRWVWIGELRNMWVATAYTDRWFTLGSLNKARCFSRLLVLQLAKRHRSGVN